MKKIKINQKTLSVSLKFLLISCFASMLLLFDACKKDNVEQDATNMETVQIASSSQSDAISPEDVEILEKLTKLGFDKQDIQFLEDFIVYQGDAGWNRNDLLQSLRDQSFDANDFLPHSETAQLSFSPIASEPHAHDRQQGISESAHTDAVTATKANNINYFVRPSVANDCGTAWVTAITNGSKKWNSIANCRVTLTKVTSQAAADIVFGSDLDTGMPSSHQNLSSSTIARAGFPSAGNPWKWISINDAFSGLANNSKTMAIMHELGHCFGYRHTGTSDGFHIHGTPTSEAESIMNPTVSSSTVWSTGDLRAQRIYYPDNLAKPTTFTAKKFNATTIEMTYKNPQATNKPYYWIHSKLFNAAGVQLNNGFIQSNVNASGVQTLYWINLTPGTTYKVSVFGENFRHDVLSPQTSTITVAL